MKNYCLPSGVVIAKVAAFTCFFQTQGWFIHTFAITSTVVSSPGNVFFFKQGLFFHSVLSEQKKCYLFLFYFALSIVICLMKIFCLLDNPILFGHECVYNHKARFFYFIESFVGPSLLCKHAMQFYVNIFFYLSKGWALHYFLGFHKRGFFWKIPPTCFLYSMTLL